MIIERNIAPYVVFAEDPILTALHKISANGQRIIFLVNESGSCAVRSRMGTSDAG